jgi:hypothetical protein
VHDDQKIVTLRFKRKIRAPSQRTTGRTRFDKVTTDSTTTTTTTRTGPTGGAEGVPPTTPPPTPPATTGGGGIFGMGLVGGGGGATATPKKKSKPPRPNCHGPRQGIPGCQNVSYQIIMFVGNDPGTFCDAGYAHHGRIRRWTEYAYFVLRPRRPRLFPNVPILLPIPM